MQNKTDTDKSALRRFLNGIYTRQEARDALRLLRDKKNDPLTNILMSELWHEIQHAPGPDASEYEREYDSAGRLFDRIHGKTVRRRIVRKVLSMAASVAILISVVAGFYYFFSRENKTEAFYTQVSAAHGQTREVVLPDGTKVILNACSQISYPQKFNGNERKVVLNGEAYFQVVKDQKQPFIVNAGGFDVRVLGTVFSVKAYRGDEVQSVNVESGKVQVDMPDAMSRLGANEQLEINTESGSYTKQESGYQDIAVWRKGNLRFSKTPVADVARQLERVYGYEITFRDGQVFDNLVSGEHDNRNLEEVLESIRLACGIKWKKDEKQRRIFLYR